MTLNEITSRHIYDVTAFFLGQLKDKSQKELDLLLTRVRSQCPRVINMNYVFDETLWMPDQPWMYNNLIRFNYQLAGQHVGYTTFCMQVDKGAEQELVSQPLPMSKAMF